jgi:uncharacterized membrane protein
LGYIQNPKHLFLNEYLRTEIITANTELTKWSRVLFEKRLVTEQAKKMTTFHGTGRFIVVFIILNQINPVYTL